MGKSNTGKFVGVFVLALIAAVGIMSLGGTFSTTQSTTTTQSTGGTGVADVLAGSVSPTGKINVQDVLSPGTTLTQTVRKRIAGTTDLFDDELTGTDISFTAEERYEIYTNSSSEYNAYRNDITIPVQETIPNSILAMEAYSHATATTIGSSTVVLDPNNAANTASNNWTEVVKTTQFTFKVPGHNKKAYGNPNAIGQPGEVCKNVMTIRGNLSSTDDVILLLNGEEIPDNAPIPKQSSFVEQTHQNTWAFYIDPILGNQEPAYTVKIIGDDDNTNLNAFNISVYDVEMYRSSDDNLIHCGIEDENNNDVGITDFVTDLIEYVLGE